MKQRNKKEWKRRLIYGMFRFLTFFTVTAFVVICNVMLFLNSSHIEKVEIKAAGYLTFANVLLLTTVFCIIDEIRRIWMVEKPVQQIQEVMNRIVQGDFQARIPYIKTENSINDLDAVIQSLNEMAAELESVETLRTDFVSNVSHELKTPLTVIQNYGTILQTPGLTEEQRIQYAKALTEQTRKLSDLISNILKLNRLENQQIFPEKKEYNLTEQICECLLVFEQAWEEKHLEMETRLEEDIMIYQDAQLLSLVWNNLFSNAMKFSREGGKVSVSVKREEEGIVVTVSDNGCGISQETGKHIFEKFYQGDTSRATQGNGLGLALVKRVIDIVGGNIKVQSILGKGTTFSVCLKEEA